MCYCIHSLVIRGQVTTPAQSHAGDRLGGTAPASHSPASRKPRIVSAPSPGEKWLEGNKALGEEKKVLSPPPKHSFSSPVLSVSHLSLPLSLLQDLKMRWRRREERKKKSIWLFLSYMNIINPECPAFGCSLRFQ